LGNTASFFNSYSEPGDFARIVTSNTAVTPLPSTWTMMLIGLAGLGFVAYRGTKRNTAALAAA